MLEKRRTLVGTGERKTENKKIKPPLRTEKRLEGLAVIFLDQEKGEHI